MADKRPNILLIMSDQHRADFMGCMGHDVCRTPNLDALAAGGVLFARTHCPFPLCGPSRMAFMTCRHPHEIGCWTNDQQLSSDIPTFAHGLLAGGYETVLSGRMHFVGLDQRHGFSQRIIGDVPESVHIAAGWKLDRVLGDLIDTPGYNPAGIIKSGPGRSGYQAYDEAVCRRTVQWLSQRPRPSGHDAPFLLVVGLAMPHCPFVAPPEDFNYYAARISPRDLPDPQANLHPVMAAHQNRCGLRPAPALEARWRATVAYYGMCSFLDRQIGLIFDSLHASGLAENTIVVYTSDHGESLGDHGLWWKDAFYNPACRVPLIVSWPRRIAGGRSVGRNVNLIDIGPTLLDLAGVEPLPDASGRSLRGLLEQGDGASWLDRTFAEDIHHMPGSPDVVPCRMVVDGPWKYNYYHGHGEELFNLKTDPGEQHDLAGQSEHAPVRDRLRLAVLAQWDPQAVQRLMRHHSQRQRLIAAWINKSHPMEPDPLWFDQPCQNSWQEVLPPGADPGNQGEVR